MAKIFKYKGDEKFTLDTLINLKDIDVDWSRTGDKNASSLHSISSYLAMFAPAMPRYFIEKLTQENDLVYDPFSGRGTTALKSREMNRRFVGSDLNPYALVLSRSKIATCTKQEAINYVNNLEINFKVWKDNENNVNKFNNENFSELRYFYSKSVLTQLIFLRENYGINWRNFSDVQNFVFGITLGIMHGKLKKDGTTIYFSLDMPNTISMAPNYVKKFAAAKNLIKPDVNIFELIRNRINQKYDELLSKKFKSNIYEINALENNKDIENNSIKLLITSPPYLSVVNYTNSNWLKLWLLGYERSNLRNEIKLSDRLNFEKYTNFMIDFLENVYDKIQIGGYIVLIVGDVHNEKLIEKVWEIIQNKVKFNLKEIYWDDKYLQTHKITNMLNGKKGKATTIEKVLLLRK
ncbi:hypothetical protein ASO20_02230 [Mycoplasma sp. (ex Biomphalaria glabrata)]|uniref:DNA methyltransferase n=1 Tax=Mycoplasma sp. (ex Biomphalaria glabrata) TaxID=1749074 RepID=UPI00073AB780|nr:DNA methyltransferase [Mycoplasma sp. (ex Biomphalaria glabrata)]ALV23455.1 hypothetical protein ASO20_02230 [Mycoplasma sp. (ex Biomphalaria glabrata)]